MRALALTRPLLNALLYFPSRAVVETPAAAGLEFSELAIETADGERLHGWWIETSRPPLAAALLLHGNGGNIGDRVLNARLLCEAGLDVLLFDYRGYGLSSGKPGEEGSYSDARAALAALRRQCRADAASVIYVGESLGGAVALALASEAAPSGLVLQSAFTSVRDVARVHYPFIPTALVPDAYPSLRRIRRLRSPLLVLHGGRDEIAPLAHGRALFEAAPGPKRMHVFDGLGHNDLLPLAGPAYVEVLRSWLDEVVRPAARSA